MVPEPTSKRAISYAKEGVRAVKDRTPRARGLTIPAIFGTSRRGPGVA